MPGDVPPSHLQKVFSIQEHAGFLGVEYPADTLQKGRFAGPIQSHKSAMFLHCVERKSCSSTVLERNL